MHLQKSPTEANDHAEKGAAYVSDNFCGCTVNADWLAACSCAAWVVLFCRNAFSIFKPWIPKCLPLWETRVLCHSYFSFIFFSRKKLCGFVFFPWFGFWSKTYLYLLWWGFLWERKKTLLPLEWKKPWNCLGLISGKIQSVSEMEFTFLESSSTVHRRGELLTESSLWQSHN